MTATSAPMAVFGSHARHVMSSSWKLISFPQQILVANSFSHYESEYVCVCAMWMQTFLKISLQKNAEEGDDEVEDGKRANSLKYFSINNKWKCIFDFLLSLLFFPFVALIELKLLNAFAAFVLPAKHHAVYFAEMATCSAVPYAFASWKLYEAPRNKNISLWKVREEVEWGRGARSSSEESKIHINNYNFPVKNSFSTMHAAVAASFSQEFVLFLITFAALGFIVGAFDSQHQFIAYCLGCDGVMVFVNVGMR